MNLVILGATGLIGGKRVNLLRSLAMLAADDSKWITGEMLLISGGLR